MTLRQLPDAERQEIEKQLATFDDLDGNFSAFSAFCGEPGNWPLGRPHGHWSVMMEDSFSRGQPQIPCISTHIYTVLMPQFCWLDSHDFINKNHQPES